MNVANDRVLNQCYIGDCIDGLREFAARGIMAQTCVTSPPYWGLRDYGVDDQIGLEASPDDYVAKLLDVFRAVREVLADDGTLWLNLGDSYYSPRYPGGTGENSTINGTRTQEASQQAKRRQRGGLSCNKGYEQSNGSQPHRAAALAGLKPKDLVGMPWRVAFALQADGWYLRQDIIWHKPNPMPESVRDRCTKAHEYLFLLSKSEHYYFDQDAISEPATFGEPNSPASIVSPFGQGYARQARSGNKARKPASDRGVPVDTGGSSSGAVAGSVPWEGDRRNKRSVWSVTTTPFPGAHFATFPRKLIEPCILAGSRPGDIVLDPFMGSGTTAQVAQALGRKWIGCEINPEYVTLQQNRLRQQSLTLEGTA